MKVRKTPFPLNLWPVRLAIAALIIILLPLLAVAFHLFCALAEWYTDFRNRRRLDPEARKGYDLINQFCGR